MSENIRSKFGGVRIRIILFMLFPSLLMIIFSHISMFTYRNIYKDTIKKNYLSFFKNFSDQSEISFDNIAYSISVLADNDKFLSVVNSSEPTSQDISYSQNALKDIKKNFPMIDSISIMKRAANRVYTQNSSYDIYEYLDNIYSYEDYNIHYWRSYRAPMSGKYILPPTTVTKIDDKENTIIPMVLTKIGNQYLTDIIVVNLSLSSILSDLQSYPMFENSTPSMLNKTTFKHYYKSSFSDINDPTLIKLLTDNKSASFNYNFLGEKSFIVSYSPTYSSLGYIYIVSTPMRAINNAMPKAINILLLIFYLIFFISLILVIMSANMLYNPIKNISDLLKIKKLDDIGTLHDSILDVLKTNSTLSTRLNYSLPYVKEQQLIHILNSTEHFLVNENITDDLNFIYDYFCSVIIKLNYTDSFYDKYDNLTEKTIELGVLNIIKSELDLNFEQFYIIPSDNHTLYVLFNLESKNEYQKIKETIENLTKLFSYDNIDLDFVTSIGSIEQGIVGLKNSHKEALEKLSGLSLFKQHYVKVNADTSKPNAIIFSHTDEIILYDQLIALNIENASNIIEEKLFRFYETERTQYEASQFYSSLFMIIFKVLRAKNIVYDTDNIGDNALINKIIGLKDADIQHILYDYINTLKARNEYKKIDISNILSYIQENYNKDIYLENLAETFNTSASYLSRLIKKETSSSFSEYLKILRINKAKELLHTTKMPIKDIYEEVGFTNRNTFIRVFKGYVGITPSEYRNR